MTRARLILLILLALLGLGLWNSMQPTRTGVSQPRGDIVLFEAVVKRVRNGQPYYAAMRTELIARGYPTASVLNWRPPATFLLLAHSAEFAHILMVGLSLLALSLTVIIFRDAPPVLTVAAGVMQLGAVVLPSIPTDGLYMPETWTGVFIVLSVLCYSLGWVRLAVCASIAAACARELALPFVAVAIGMAFQAGRTRELRWFAGGLTVFAGYYLGHAWGAITHMQPGDMAHKASWIAFGGWDFVVRTVAMGGWYLMLPPWTAAVGAVVVVASLWSPADRHLKAVVVVYLAGFCVVGQPFNTYWGLMTGPTWGIATAYGLWGLHDLVRKA